jgi:hypothetical protein
MTAKWWKDRDKSLPVPTSDPLTHHDDEEQQQELPGEDIGDIADDDPDELDDVELPDRGADD